MDNSFCQRGCCKSDTGKRFLKFCKLFVKQRLIECQGFVEFLFGNFVKCVLHLVAEQSIVRFGGIDRFFDSRFQVEQSLLKLFGFRTQMVYLRFEIAESVKRLEIGLL